MVYYEWLTQRPWISRSFILSLCRLCRHKTNRPTRKTSIKKEEEKVLCKWLTEYPTEWETLPTLRTSLQDVHVSSSAYRLTHSIFLFVPCSCLPSPSTAVAAFHSSTEWHPFYLCPNLSVTFITHSKSPLTSLGAWPHRLTFTWWGCHGLCLFT